MADKDRTDKKSVLVTEDKTGGPSNWTKEDTDAFLSTMKKRYARCVESEKDNRRDSLEDLEFLDGRQWDPDEEKRRAKRFRPCLTDNRLPTYVDQVVGDERQNRPRVQIKPVDSKGDIRIARIREGLIWGIEFRSNAEMIYDYACEMQVSCGFGAWRVLTRYTEENPFIQEIYLERIPNPFNVYLDPDAKDPVYADAKYGFIVEKVLIEDFKDMYPGQDTTSISMHDQGVDKTEWINSEYVRVLEYFIRKPVPATFCLMNDGSVMLKEDAEKAIKEWGEYFSKTTDSALANIASFPVNPDTAQPPQPPQPSQDTQPVSGSPLAAGTFDVGPAGQPTPVEASPPALGASLQGLFSMPQKPEIVREKKSYRYVIKHYICTAYEIIKEEDFPGEFIPIVMVIGKERNVNGKKKVRGLVRNAKDPQRLLNYWTTSAAETIALAPKTPWLGTDKMFEGYEGDYASAHIENFPFLKFNPDPRMPNTFPQRAQPINPPVAIFAEVDKAVESIKHAVGMFNADVGDVGPERSGLAIMQRKQPGDIGTFAFIDNLSRSICHSGRIINSLIPYVYDTERDVRIRNIDDTETFVPINTIADRALEMIRNNPDHYDQISADDLEKMIARGGEFGGHAKYNDITVGKYGVVVKVGPSYATQRDMAAQNLISLVQAQPQLAMIAGDILVKNMDFPGAEELSERLRKALPPGIVKLRPGEKPPEPQGPTPEQQVQLAKLDVEKAKIEVEKGRMKVEEFRRTIEKEKLDVQEVRLQTEKIKAINQLNEANASTRQLILNLIAEVLGVSPAQKAIMAARANQIQSEADMNNAMNPTVTGSGIVSPEPEPVTGEE